MLLEVLIDDGFSVKKIFEIVCVSERTIFTMLKYDLKSNDYSKITDTQFDSDILSLTNDFPLCGKTTLRELLKGRGVNVKRYRLWPLSRIVYLHGG